MQPCHDHDALFNTVAARTHAATKVEQALAAGKDKGCTLMILLHSCLIRHVFVQLVEMNLVDAQRSDQLQRACELLEQTQGDIRKVVGYYMDGAGTTTTASSASMTARRTSPIKQG